MKTTIRIEIGQFPNMIKDIDIKILANIMYNSKIGRVIPL